MLKKIEVGKRIGTLVLRDVTEDTEGDEGGRWVRARCDCGVHVMFRMKELARGCHDYCRLRLGEKNPNYKGRRPNRPEGS